MTLNAEAIRRLIRLGYVAEADLRIWRQMWEREGEAFFWRFLENEEQAAQEYRRWYPRLEAYAVECRRLRPAPTRDEFSVAEREQYRILLENMRQFAASEDRRCIMGLRHNQAAIASTTRVGLVAAEEVFGQSGVIILEESERERWFTENCPINERGFSWYVFAWWTLSEGVSCNEEARIRENYPIPEGCSYWELVSGVQWGSLAGGANHELWMWNGKTAEFIEVYCVDTY